MHDKEILKLVEAEAYPILKAIELARRDSAIKTLHFLGNHGFQIVNHEEVNWILKMNNLVSQRTPEEFFDENKRSINNEYEITPCTTNSNNVGKRPI